MIFDTHCHGYWNGLEHRQDEVLRNMCAEGVTRSVQIGTGLEMSRKALTLSRDWGPETWCTAGLHPTGCQDMPESSAPEFISQLEDLIQANRDKMVAIGETGLDCYHLTRGNETKQKQIRIPEIALNYSRQNGQRQSEGIFRDV
jgi:TatD DNase family protein